MTKDTMAVESRTPVLDAIKILVAQEISGVPVVDRDLNLVGVLTEKDALRLLREREAHGAVVEDFMTKDVVACDGEDDLNKVYECLILLREGSWWAL